MTLLTAYDQNCEGIGKLTEPLMEAYAKRHGLAFKVVRSFTSHPCWQKLELIHDLIKTGEPVLWLDADVIITNPELTPWTLDLRGGLQCSQDWADTDGPYDFQTGTAVIHPDATPLYEAAMELTRYSDHPQFGQTALRLCDTSGWRFLINVHGRRVYNPVPEETGSDCGLTVPEPWQEGDWLCHLTNLSMDRRVELFEKYKPKNL